MFSTIGNLIGTVMTNEANAGENYNQRAWSEEMWRKNNEYNTPANQVKRLREAGLNPHFALQGGQLGTGTSSTPAQQTSPIAYDFSPIGEGVSRSVELYQQRQLNNAEIDYKNSQAQNWHIKNITQLWRDYTEIQNLIKSGKLSDQQIEVAKGQAQSIWTTLQSLAEKNEVDIAKVKSEKVLNEARARVEDAHAVYQQILNRFVPQQQSIITSNLAKEGRKIDSEVYRNNREGALAAAHQALSNAQKDGVQIDNRTKSEMAEYIVDEQFAKANEAAYRAGNQQKEFYFGRGSELPYEAFEHDDSRARVPVRNKAHNRSY